MFPTRHLLIGCCNNIYSNINNNNNNTNNNINNDNNNSNNDNNNNIDNNDNNYSLTTLKIMNIITSRSLTK